MIVKRIKTFFLRGMTNTDTSTPNSLNHVAPISVKRGAASALYTKYSNKALIGVTRFYTTSPSLSSQPVPSNPKMRKFIRLIALVIVLLIAWQFVNFGMNHFIPAYRDNVFSVVSPSLYWFKLFFIFIFILSLGILIWNWNKPVKKTTVELPENFTINEFGNIEIDKKRKWIKPLKIFIGVSLILLILIFYNITIGLFVNHPIIMIVLTFIMIIGWLCLHDDFFNMMPNEAPLTNTDYAPKIGPWLDWFEDSKWDKLIRLILLLDILMFLCFFEWAINSTSIVALILSKFIGIIAIIGIIFMLFYVSIQLYMLILMLLLPVKGKKLVDYSPSELRANNWKNIKVNRNRRSFSTSAPF